MALTVTQIAARVSQIALTFPQIAVTVPQIGTVGSIWYSSCNLRDYCGNLRDC